MPEYIYEPRVTGITVIPKNQPLYSEMGTTVTIVDEAGGEFVEVSQHGGPDLGKIAINPEEWPVLRDTITEMLKQCRGAT